VTEPGSRPTAQEVIEELGLQPIPVEGGQFALTWADERSCGIYYLMTPDDCSGLHALPSMELWAYHAGAPVKMLLLYPDGRVEEPVLGPDVLAGQRPQLAVHPKVQMAAEPLGDWSLVGTFMAPAFDPATVEFGAAEDLVRTHPAAAERIRRLARR
jgi:predicted cupin superfamily sugar epimerase